MFNFKVREAPLGFKLLVTVFLLGYAMAQALGMTMAYLETKVINPSAEEYFAYLSPSKLVSLSHPHFFGYSTLYFLTGLLFLFTERKKSVKTWLPAVTLLAALLDICTWWGIKYVSDKINIFTVIFGIVFAGGFAVMALTVLYEMWLMREKVS